MRLAVAQFASSTDKTENIERLSALTRLAHRDGAHMVVFPESAMHTFGETSDDLRPAAEPLDGPFVDALLRLTYRVGIKVVAGMFEAIPGDDRVYNTAVVVDPRDGVVAAHRKQFLYDAFGDRESDRFRPGTDDSPIVEVEGLKVGLAICYEIRFPSYIQQIADRGADVLLLPAAWVAGPLKEDHWQVMVRARAMENTIYVAAAGMTGDKYCGRSMFVDPLGVVEVGLGEAEGIATGEITPERLAHARARLPVVAQRHAGAPASPPH